MSVAQFSVTPTVKEGCLVLVVEGDLDLAEAPQLDAALEACTDGLPVVVDLSTLTFIDSSGLHALLGDRNGTRPAALVCLPGSNVGRVLDIIDANKSIPIYNHVSEAVERLGS